MASYVIFQLLREGEAKTIYIIAKIFNIIQEIEGGNHSKVILIDEMEVGL